MFISKLNHWLDEVDPYAMHRMILHKALVIATVMVLVYWFFKPVNFIAFALPVFSVSLYEMPFFANLKQKEYALLLCFTAVLICSMSFYLLFPFRLLFLFYSIVFFSVLYFLFAKFFPPLKYFAVLTISTSAVFMTTQPQGDLQVAYNIFCSMILSMATLFLSLKCLSNRYLKNWLLAQQKFIQALEREISSTMAQHNVSFFVDEVTHIDMVYCFRGLLRKKYLIHAYKITYHIRNIQFALSNVDEEEKNTPFWQTIKHHLQTLRHHMKQGQPYRWSNQSFNPETTLQEYTVNYLRLAIIQWNKLCKML